MSRTPSRTPAAALAAALTASLAVPVLLAPPASADATYRTSRYALVPVGGAPLRSGAVVNAHAEGPQVYAQERYLLNGALASTTYAVSLRLHADAACTVPVVVVPAGVLETNRAGNAHGGATFRPADAAPLVPLGTVGIVWDVTGPDGQVAYTTGCQVVRLD